MPAHPTSRGGNPGRLLAPLLVASLLSGCGRRAQPPSPAPAPKVLGVSIAEATTLDPGLATEESGVTIAQALFEGLVRHPAGDGPMVPGVASSWETSPDGRDWTFHLRPDAAWSDGRPVTAADFRYAWRRALDPATGSGAASQLFLIEGAEDLHRGRGDPSALGVRVLDDRTLVVRLVAPAPWFLQALGFPVFSPLRRDVVEAHGPRWTRPGNLVSNGPFRLAEARAGDRVELVRNEHWWDAKNVVLEGVTFHFLSSERLVFDWFQAGKLQWMKGAVARDRIPELRRTRPAEFHADPVLCTAYAALRTDRAPFDDPDVRRAFDRAIDKERLTREVLMGGQEPALGFVPTAIRPATGYDPARGEGFDPAAARVLLDRHRATRGELPAVTYLYNSGEANRVVAEFLQAQWREHLGLDVAVEATEWKTLLSRVRSGDYQAARASWCADYVDPANILEVLRSGAPSNYPGFADPAYDAALDRARSLALDPPARLAALRSAEDRLVAQRPVAPLYFFTRIYLLSPRVTGFVPNLLDVHPLERLGLRDP